MISWGTSIRAINALDNIGADECLVTLYPFYAGQDFLYYPVYLCGGMAPDNNHNIESTSSDGNEYTLRYLIDDFKVVIQLHIVNVKADNCLYRKARLAWLRQGNNVNNAFLDESMHSTPDSGRIYVEFFR